VHVELINTGSELMLGRVLNTHQQWLCRQLSDLGYQVNRQIAISDEARQIQEAVRESLTRSDLILVTGGLGPTSDDLTRDLIAQLLGRELLLDAEILKRLEEFVAKRRRVLSPSMKLQAMVPAGARVLQNDWGTAPGLAIEVRPNPFRPESQTAWLILLPGPPRELRPMFKERVVPLLMEVAPPPAKLVCRILRTTGLGESSVEEKIASPLQKLVAAGLDLGYCARIGEVEVRLAASGDLADRLVRQAEATVRQQLGPIIFAEGDETLEVTLVRMLTERGQTLALAESCTGGMLAHRITNVPGASAILKCGLVTYSNEAKQNFLGVTAAALEEHGAVSEVVARQMAEGARQKCGADFAISVTGIAGPGGGSEAKPVGTVFMALATANRTFAEKYFNPFDRETFKYVSSQQALDLLRRTLSAS
jgi:nicotinamide-nucleotide amidase